MDDTNASLQVSPVVFKSHRSTSAQFCRGFLLDFATKSKSTVITFRALTLLVGRQEGHLA